MAAKIYATPKDLPVPEINLKNYNHQEHEAAQNKYLDDLRAFIAKRGYTSHNAGKLIYFHVADGAAIYMVLSMRPLSLIHIPFDDAYQFSEIHLMTAKRVQQLIDQREAIDKLFSKKS